MCQKNMFFYERPNKITFHQVPAWRRPHQSAIEKNKKKLNKILHHYCVIYFLYCDFVHPDNFLNFLDSDLRKTVFLFCSFMFRVTSSVLWFSPSVFLFLFFLYEMLIIECRIWIQRISGCFVVFSNMLSISIYDTPILRRYFQQPNITLTSRCL